MIEVDQSPTIEVSPLQRFEAVRQLGASAVGLREQAMILEEQAGILGSEPYEAPHGYELHVTFIDEAAAGYERGVGVEIWEPGAEEDEDGVWVEFDDAGERSTNGLFKRGHSDTEPNPDTSSLTPNRVFVGTSIQYDETTKQVYIYSYTGLTRVPMISGIKVVEHATEDIKSALTSFTAYNQAEPGPASDNRLFTIAEAAIHIGVTTENITRLTRAGKLTATRTIGGGTRYSTEAIARLLDEQSLSDRTEAKSSY